MKNVLILISLILLFSCKEENESTPPEEEIIEDSIRTTICNDIGFDFDYTYIRCKNEFCDTGICITYHNIWKEIFLEKNNLDDNYFNKYVTICETGIHEWDEGFSYFISYILTHGWAKTKLYDSFIIKIHAGNTHEPHVIIRRGAFLTKQEITIALYYNAFASHISKISNLTQLKYESIHDALNDLIDSAFVDTLCATGIKIEGTSGNLTLEASAEYLYEYNSCFFGYIDLFTGETQVEESYCFIEDCW